MTTKNKNASSLSLSRRGFLGTIAAWAAAAAMPLPNAASKLFVAPVAPHLNFYAYETMGCAIIDKRALDLFMKADFQ